MGRTIKHLSLHRIDGTELRIVSDVDAGVLPIIQQEEAVIRGYARGTWPHDWVTLFILQDLQPLMQQLRPGVLPLQGVGEATPDLPVVNVYDLADLSTCHVFINQRMMASVGYWEDALAIQALLAHEHAHPLTENQTARASRGFGLRLDWQPTRAAMIGSALRPRLDRLLRGLAEELCLYAPRELFANEMVLQSGFGDALLHLDRLNVANAHRGVAGRSVLLRQLQEEVAQGHMEPETGELLVLIGDMQAYLDLALEVASFFRAGWEQQARGLERSLKQGVLCQLDPGVTQVYTALRNQYLALSPDLTTEGLKAWNEGVLSVLRLALARKGLTLTHQWLNTNEAVDSATADAERDAATRTRAHRGAELGGQHGGRPETDR